MKVHNYMEDTVDLEFPRILLEEKYKNQCTCQQCINDIKAIALNSLRPRYVGTETGSVLSKANMFAVQLDTDVTKVLVETVDKVSKLPKHKVMG